MKLVFVIPSLRGGGAERVFANLLGLWTSEDEVHLVLLHREGPYLDQVPPRVHIHDLGGGRFLGSLLRLSSLIRGLRPDGVLGTQAHVNVALGLLKPWLRARRVVGRETSMPTEVRRMKGSSSFTELIYAWGYRGLDAVICSSRAMAEDVSTNYRVPPSRVKVIPNPVLVDQVRTWAQSEVRPPVSGRTLVAVGRLESNKGFDLLLEAMTRLPGDVRLSILGEGRERQALEAQMAALGLGDRVHLAGFQKNGHPWVAAADVFVLSSRFEGMPNAALEALVLGRPVVAFAGPWGVDAVVDEGRTGLLARPYDPEDLARALNEALQRPWDHEAIARQAAEKFDGPTVAARYREVLQ